MQRKLLATSITYDSVLFATALLPLRYYHGANNYAGASRAGSRRKGKRGRARERRDTSRRSSSAQRIIVSGPSLDIIMMQIVYKPAVSLPRIIQKRKNQIKRTMIDVAHSRSSRNDRLQ